mgnify:CR=1 FL=1
MNFSARQRLALEHACLRAADTMHPRFAVRGTGWTTILTINK